MKYQPWKRTLCCLLTAVLILGNIPIFSFAEESDGLCPHHTVHTPECGYTPASPGSPCTHEHTEGCYQTVTECVHAHDDTCGYIPAVEGHGCDCVPDAEGVLTHAEGCGYVEAVEGTPCGHTCSAESGCVTRELVCPHRHNDSCGYIAPTPEQPCTYVCQTCADSKAAEGVQALMDALPTLEEVKAMSMEAQADAYNQVQAAYKAYEALTESQKALIVSAESTFAPLFDYFNSLTAPAANVLASGNCGANLTWKLTDDGVLTISGTGSMTGYSNANSTPWYSHLSDIKQIVIKDGVTSIGSYAFGVVNYPNISSVTVPESVTSLGLYAFGGNGIQVKYPGTMEQWLSLSFYFAEDHWSAPGAVCSDGTILTHGYCGTYGVSGSPKYVLTGDGCMRIYGTGDMTFYRNLNNTSHWVSYNSSITSVVVEDGVTSIADYSFGGCQNLTQVSLPDDLRSIGNYAFRSCTALKSIDIPSAVTYLGSGVFQSSGLESIVIPEGVKYIKDYSFLNCASLRSVTIPSSVTDIYEQAFYNCSALTDVSYSGSEQTWNQIAVSPNNDSLRNAKIHYTNQCVNGHQFNSNGFCTVCGAFGGTCGDDLTWVFTDDGVLTISGTGAMWDYDAAYRTPWSSKMSSIKSLVLPAGITHIGNYAFRGSSLESVSFGSPSLSLGNYSFADCASLKTIDFGSGTIRPGEWVFDHCTALTSVSVPANVTMDGSSSGIGSGYRMFGGCTGLQTATVDCAYVGPYFFENCSAMTRATFTNKDVQFYFLEKNDDHPFNSNSKAMNVTVEGYLCSRANVLVQKSQGRYNLNLTFSQIAGDTTQHTEQVLPGTATCTDAGLSEGKVCSVCGYVIEKQTNVDALGHDLQSHDAQAATCTENGWEAYDTCSRCNYTTYKEIPAAHTLSPVEEKAATCTEAGNIAHYHCSACQKNFEDANSTKELTTVSIPASHNLSPVAEKAATCTEAGNIAHYHCTVCQKNFEDANSTKELTTVSIPASHNLSPVAEKAATCTEAGNIAHYHCSVCDKNFEDETGTKVLTTVAIPAGHNFLDGVCTRCGALGGTCGENLTWVLTADGTLTISGTGAMADYPWNSNAPWYTWRDSITSLVLEDGITAIGQSAFKDCTKISSVSIPSGVTRIGNLAFGNCTSLSNVSIPNTVTCIELAAFNNCSSLSSVTIPNYLSPVDEGMFGACTSLQEIKLSNSSTGNTNLKSVDGVLFTLDGTLLVQYPAGKTGSYTIPDGVTRLYSEAFDGSIHLSSITIPDTVSHIGRCVFNDCTNLSEITFTGDAPKTLLDDSFFGITATVYYPAENTTWTSEVRQNYGGTITWKAVCSEHSWGEWAVTTPATPEADGVETRKCAVCQQEETRPLVYSGNRLVLTGTELENQSTVWIDGAPVSVQTDDAGSPYVVLPEGSSSILVTYSFNTGSGDRHTQYPTGMNVYRVETTDSGLTVTHLPELQNLLQYSGCSIRITGNKGIRMITSINKGTRSALLGDGLAGYTLVEYGTALCRASALAGGAPLVLGTAGVKSNHAYKRGVADPIFKDTGSLIQYTNVLVGFTDEDCKEDIAMRPYIILADEKGETVTIYGGVVYRSIGYIAWQNRNAFTPGSAAYEYVWNIIRYVYGDQYDADYKG